MILVAYWTGGNFYRESSEKMCKRCGELGITHHIEHIEDSGTWLGNVRQKVSFLSKCLERFNQTLFYLDVDAEIVQNPLPYADTVFELAVPKSSNDWGLMDFCQTVTQSAIELLKGWNKIIEDNPRMGSHSSLSELKKQFPDRIGWLPAGFGNGTIVKLGVSPK